MTNVIYGITQKAIRTYRICVAYGASHEFAMSKLKALYQHNKEFALNVNPPDFSSVYGHPDYVSKARDERVQADKG